MSWLKAPPKFVTNIAFQPILIQNISTSPFISFHLENTSLYTSPAPKTVDGNFPWRPFEKYMSESNNFLMQFFRISPFYRILKSERLLFRLCPHGSDSIYARSLATCCLVLPNSVVRKGLSSWRSSICCWIRLLFLLKIYLFILLTLLYYYLSGVTDQKPIPAFTNRLTVFYYWTVFAVVQIQKLDFSLFQFCKEDLISLAFWCIWVLKFFWKFFHLEQKSAVLD